MSQYQCNVAGQQHAKDEGVPDFLEGCGKRYQPLRRDERMAEVADLVQSGVSRILACGESSASMAAPYVHFPNGEYVQHFPFLEKDWQESNMEQEYHRIAFMLRTHPERRFPRENNGVLRRWLYDGGSALSHWGKSEEEVGQLAAIVHTSMAHRMEVNKVLSRPVSHNPHQEGAYEAYPELYIPTRHGLAQEAFWYQGVQEVEEAYTNGTLTTKVLREFLSLYHVIKDPITPPLAIVDRQVVHFQELLGELECKTLNGEQVVQFALESSFLALPKAEEVEILHYAGVHELPYVYVELFRLPRGEFANPKRVLEVARELLEEEEPRMTPITVAHIPMLGGEDMPLGIIDGNNRATAMVLIHYLAECARHGGQSFVPATIDTFVEAHGLSIEWVCDLSDSLAALQEDRELLQWLEVHAHRLHTHARYEIPALLVQEPSFFTVNVHTSRRGAVQLLQPVHQSMYNGVTPSLAIPSKQQSHGRAMGNHRFLPLR